jgi:pyridoxal phosphate enzyme (YggS family)
VDTTIDWHMIGHLQTNKAGQAVELFSMVQSVDSLKLAQALDRRAVALGAKRLPVLLEVYVGDDPERPGFRPDSLLDAAAQIIELPGLEVRGLMTVAPLGLDQAATRAAFKSVRELRDKLASAHPRVHFGDLSMGMSDDFELAVEEGSTMVRIGRAIFGSRE